MKRDREERGGERGGGGGRSGLTTGATFPRVQSAGLRVLMAL